MSHVELDFHKQWLGDIQPYEGVVVSTPVLLEKECFARNPPALHYQLRALCSPANDNARKGAGEPPSIQDLPRFLEELLGLTADLWDAQNGYRKDVKWAGTIPEALSLYAPEGPQTIRPTLALRRQGSTASVSEADGEAAQAGAAYEMLLWELPREIELDKNEASTGPWDYPPSNKFDRLLRAARVPIGVVSNSKVLRLLYAPHGEASGHLDFRIADMSQVGGRAILDALVMLLHANRFFSVTEERALPAILSESRKYQANVTNQLGEQVFEALTILLRGFEAAAERDGRKLLDEALARENDHLTQGLLTVLLRMVFVLFAEDRDLLPTEQPLYAQHYSLFAMYERLLADHGAFPDSMSRRFGAWGQLVALFRALYQGVSHGELKMPARRGTLFNPNIFAFLEGWDPEGTAPMGAPELQAGVKLPTLDDETVFQVLSKLIMLDGQRLSYRTLDVEQIGSVYEGLMGFHVSRVAGKAVRMRPDGVWLTGEEVLDVPGCRRAAFLAEHVNLPKAQAGKLAKELEGTKKTEAAFEVLQGYAVGRTKDAREESSAKAGQLVLQPGPERRRTSTHYTPRPLIQKLVERGLAPLLACMTESGERGPTSERILQLRVCDPAMGSGAFLVEACRYLGDALVAAWTVEGSASRHEDPVLAARRRIAQCCLYGVDKNAAAVELGKLSLWLVTLSKHRPFTFLDANLRHGDSLVGLSLEQLMAFHWKPQTQRGFAELRIEEALQEAIDCREQLRELAQKENGVNPDPREKAILLRDADDALTRLRLIGDVCVGAFFAGDTEKARERERLRRRDLVQRWLAGDSADSEIALGELRALQSEILRTQTPFHWPLEFVDVFATPRPDPLAPGDTLSIALMDCFVGNPAFLGGTMISTRFGASYLDWLAVLAGRTGGRADLCSYFFLRAHSLLGHHGTVALVTTNTILQGDTRELGLAQVLGPDCRLYSLNRNLPWAGDAAVTVDLVCTARGRVLDHTHVVNRAPGAIEPSKNPKETRLDSVPAPCINSYGDARREVSSPKCLIANGGASFLGCKVGGQGFVLEPTRAAALLAAGKRNAEIVKPYIGGEEVNASPEQAPDRFVIDFAKMELDEAGVWPALLEIVRRDVKPYRDSVGRESWRKRWWQFAEVYPSMRAAIAPLSRCLVTARTSKHTMFSFQPTDRVFSENLIVFCFEAMSPFAILQSQLHLAWVQLLSSTLESRQGYRTSDCFETFPFPQPDPRTTLPKLEKVGGQLYQARAKYMLDTQQGLTKTYNALKDPSCSDKRILTLREQHEAMDAAVLAEYGWNQMKAPPLCPKTDADMRLVESFKSKVIDQLYELNAERAQQEQLAGLAKGKLRPPKAKPVVVRSLDNEADNSNSGTLESKKTKVDRNERPDLAKRHPTPTAGEKAGGSR